MTTSIAVVTVNRATGPAFTVRRYLGPFTPTVVLLTETGAQLATESGDLLTA